MDDPKQLINRLVEELWIERRLELADAVFVNYSPRKPFLSVEL